jgi:uncharacterized protein with PIN domain
MSDLKSVDEWNAEALERYGAANGPRKTGIACPKCGTEMLDHRLEQLLVIPPRKWVDCPNCKNHMSVVA